MALPQQPVEKGPTWEQKYGEVVEILEKERAAGEQKSKKIASNAIEIDDLKLKLKYSEKVNKQVLSQATQIEQLKARDKETQAKIEELRKENV